MQNQENITIDYIIVGQGIAGTLLAHTLSKHHKTFVIIDEDLANTSSKIAAGMYNPISGKRMVKNWLIDEIMPSALQTYSEIESTLNCKLIKQEPIYQLFGSVKEQNDFGLKTEDQNFKKYVNLNPPKLEQINQPFGAFSIAESGWVNTKILIEESRNWFKQNALIFNEVFNYNQLIRYKTHLQYKHITAKKIVFCQGYKNNQNPYFNWLPFVLCKGEVLTIQSSLNFNYIVKKGIYLVNLGDNLYKVGATYNWDDLTENTSIAGLEFLTQKITEIIGDNFKVIRHQANIRPTTKDRKPFIGMHPEINNLYIFNGLGTKGVLIAPFFASQLYNFIEHQTPLHPEADIHRYIKYFSNPSV